MKKYMNIILFLLLFFFFFSTQTHTAQRDQKFANEVGEQLYEILKQPDSLKVVVNKVDLWIEAKGADIDGIRVDNIGIRAKLKKGVDSYDKENPANLIESSEGEIVLLEADVNNYFAKEGAIKGFSELIFDFTSKGFSAEGKYAAEFLFNLTVPLSASGKLGIENDAVYLKETILSIQGISATETISQFIVNKLNPLLSFKKIPFPITFDKIIMSDISAKMTSNPKPFSKGATWSK
jgi:hypothetical protein